MTFDWLKSILGDAYTEDADKAVAAEIGKRFTAKADFEAREHGTEKHQGPAGGGQQDHRRPAGRRQGYRGRAQRGSGV